MLIVGNVVTLGIYTMRLLGMDINKFHFTSDEEFLEMSEEDREQVEIRVKVDKNIFIRFYKRIARNLNYFYLEHKRICNTIFGIIGVIIVASIFKFVFITNRSYNEGDFYSANGYTIKINKSYFTDKDNWSNGGAKTIYAYYYGSADGEYAAWPGVPAQNSYVDNRGNRVYRFQPPKSVNGTYPYPYFRVHPAPYNCRSHHKHWS